MTTEYFKQTFKASPTNDTSISPMGDGSEEYSHQDHGNDWSCLLYQLVCNMTGGNLKFVLVFQECESTAFYQPVMHFVQL